MSKQNNTSGQKIISEIGDAVQNKISEMQETEGTEIELSEIDLNEVSGGYKISGCVTYETKTA